MELILITLIGCIIVGIFDAIGAFLSRVLKFKYVWLTFGSIAIYGIVAFYAAKFNGLMIGVMTSGIIGVFDATIGMLISKKFNANIPKDDVKNMSVTPRLVFSMGIFASVIGLITILLFN